jgi:hypothetical protein
MQHPASRLTSPRRLQVRWQRVCFYRFSGAAIDKRKSKKRNKGDEFEQDVTVDADKYVDVMTEQVLPDIRAKMAHCDMVVVQHDGATPHTGQEAEERIRKAVNARRAPNIDLVLQPAQSPDLNVNDIGFAAFDQFCYASRSRA